MGGWGAAAGRASDPGLGARGSPEPGHLPSCPRSGPGTPQAGRGLPASLLTGSWSLWPLPGAPARSPGEPGRPGAPTGAGPLSASRAVTPRAARAHTPSPGCWAAGPGPRWSGQDQPGSKLPLLSAGCSWRRPDLPLPPDPRSLPTAQPAPPTRPPSCWAVCLAGVWAPPSVHRPHAGPPSAVLTLLLPEAGLGTLSLRRPIWGPSTQNRPPR